MAQIQNIKILVVDDDEFFRKVYSAKLTQEGFTVSVASNGEEALAKLSQEMPNLMILDLIMPKKDGFEVLTQLNASGQIKTLPVLIFSTLEQQEDVEKAKKLGAKDYINKSDVNFKSLTGKIRELVK